MPTNTGCRKSSGAYLFHNNIFILKENLTLNDLKESQKNSLQDLFNGVRSFHLESPQRLHVFENFRQCWRFFSKFHPTLSAERISGSQFNWTVVCSAEFALQNSPNRKVSWVKVGRVCWPQMLLPNLPPYKILLSTSPNFYAIIHASPGSITT